MAIPMNMVALGREFVVVIVIHNHNRANFTMIVGLCKPLFYSAAKREGFAVRNTFGLPEEVSSNKRRKFRPERINSRGKACLQIRQVAALGVLIETFAGVRAQTKVSAFQDCDGCQPCLSVGGTRSAPDSCKSEKTLAR